MAMESEAVRRGKQVAKGKKADEGREQRRAEFLATPPGGERNLCSVQKVALLKSLRVNGGTHTYEEVAQAAKLDKRRLYEWQHVYLARGAEGLRDQGRPRAFSKSQLVKMSDDVVVKAKEGEALRTKQKRKTDPHGQLKLAAANMKGLLRTVNPKASRSAVVKAQQLVRNLAGISTSGRGKKVDISSTERKRAEADVLNFASNAACGLVVTNVLGADRKQDVCIPGNCIMEMDPVWLQFGPSGDYKVMADVPEGVAGAKVEAIGSEAAVVHNPIRVKVFPPCSIDGSVGTIFGLFQAQLKQPFSMPKNDIDYAAWVAIMEPRMQTITLTGAHPYPQGYSKLLIVPKFGKGQKGCGDSHLFRYMYETEWKKMIDDRLAAAAARGCTVRRFVWKGDGEGPIVKFFEWLVEAHEATGDVFVSPFNFLIRKSLASQFSQFFFSQFFTMSLHAFRHRS